MKIKISYSTLAPFPMKIPHFLGSVKFDFIGLIITILAGKPQVKTHLKDMQYFICFLAAVSLLFLSAS